MALSSKESLDLVAQTIFDKKGFNILALDVRGVTSLTDYILIAEGSVDRHVVAIAKEIIAVLKEKGEKPLSSEGLQTGDWIVLDYLNFMIHLFMPGIRDKYCLEELFREGEVVELNIDIKTGSSQL
ncbi:MAG: Ribosomal silencing factor RsfS [Chlamydiae bacterium]|nr:Ribosomal silencing factor RsfS [Chlamydiota bacterium]